MEVLDWPSSITQILETRLEKAESNPDHPSDFLKMEWLCEPGDNDTTNVADVITLSLGRRCRLSCDPSLLRQILNLLEAAVSGTEFADSGPKIAHVHQIPEKDGLKTLQKPSGQKLEKDGLKKASLRTTKLCLSTGQVLLELLLSGTHGLNEGDESFLSPATELVREGLVLSWDGLDVSVVFKGHREPSATVSSSGCQLASLSGGSAEYIVPPTTVELVLTGHQPSSSLDM